MTTKVFKAAAGYDPVHEDEIHLRLDDKVSILHEYDDGWVLARNETTQQVGLVPKNFLVADTLSVEQVAPIQRTDPLPDDLTTSITAPFQENISQGLSLTLVIEKMENLKSFALARAQNPSHIGSLKIAVAGDSGIGKTCFISKLSRSSLVVARESYPQVVHESGITEMKASTMDESPIMDTEAQTGISEQFNLTWVDTPGFGAYVDAMMTINPVISYLKSQFAKTQQLFSDSFVSEKNVDKMQKILSASNGAHTHVDVCVYGILHRLKPVDKEFLKRLSPYVVIIPVIVKSDTLDKAEVFRLKTSVLEELKRSNIKVFSFGMELEECHLLAKNGVSGAIPFAISNIEQVHSMGGGRINELEDLSKRILLMHCNELRQASAMCFAKWRVEEAALVKEREKEEQEKLRIQRQLEQDRLEKERIEQARKEQEQAPPPISVSPPTLPSTLRPAIGQRLSSRPDLYSKRIPAPAVEPREPVAQSKLKSFFWKK